MNLDKAYIQELLEIYTENDGDSYRAKDAKAAITRARITILNEARHSVMAILDELEQAEETRLNNWYNEDAIKAASISEWTREMKERKTQETEVRESTYYQLLEYLPPIYSPKGFFVGEPYDHQNGIARHTHLYAKDGKYYAQLLPLNHFQTNK